jgi:Flp pilus assembly protein TadG
MRPHTFNSEVGSALVEAAIVMPIFFLMVAGTIQFGHLYSSLIVLRNASAVGARTAVLGTDQTTTQVCDSARNALSSQFEPSLLECVTSPASLPAVSGTPVTVTLSYPLPLFSLGNDVAPGTTWTLTAQTIMQ